MAKQANPTARAGPPCLYVTNDTAIIALSFISDVPVHVPGHTGLKFLIDKLGIFTNALDSLPGRI